MHCMQNSGDQRWCNTVRFCFHFMITAWTLVSAHFAGNPIIFASKMQLIAANHQRTATNGATTIL